METYPFTDNTEKKQYELHVGDLTPKIEYIKNKNGEIYLTHTEVPSALEGKGIGSQLVEQALKDIERQGLRLVPLCPFVAGYIQKHPDWKRIVMQGINIGDPQRLSTRHPHGKENRIFKRRTDHHLAARGLPACGDLRQNAASGIPSQRTPLAQDRTRSDRPANRADQLLSVRRTELPDEYKIVSQS